MSNTKRILAIAIIFAITIITFGTLSNVFAVEEEPVAMIGETTYETLELAVRAVPTDGTQKTIKLLKDVDDGPGFKAQEGQNFIVDFQGHSYCGSSPTVGSTGTETQAFQLLKGSTVVFKNGTVSTGGVNGKMVIQNYSNLTLEDMVIDGNPMMYSDSGKYVISCNFGSITFKGNTTIKTKGQQRAFDLWYGMSSVYDDGITITFDENFTGTVSGTIEYGAAAGGANRHSDWKDRTKLIIKNGTFNTTFEASSSNFELSDANISISGGTFVENPTEYVENGYIEYEVGDKYVVDKASIPTFTNATEIEIEEEKVEAYVAKVGEKVNIEEETNPAGYEKYTTFTLIEGDDVAKLEENTITALKPGMATIVYNHGRLGGVILVMVYEVVPDDKASNADKIAAQELSTAIESDDDEVLGLTQEEEVAIVGAIAEGKTITTEVVTQPMEKVDDEDVQLVGEKVSGKEKIAGYYDISVLVKADGEEIARLRELGQKIKIELAVPEKLPEVASGYERTYSVIRVHDGKAEVIAEGLKEKDGKVPVETDKFSTYALTYKDTVSANPKTGDAITITVAIFVVAVIGLIAVKKSKK